MKLKNHLNKNVKQNREQEIPLQNAGHPEGDYWSRRFIYLYTERAVATSALEI